MKRTLSIFLSFLIIISSFSALNLQTSAYYGNDSYGTAIPLSLNQDFIDNIYNSEDKDWYRFTLLEAGKISISFSHDYIDSTGAYWYVGLYDEDKSRMLDNWIYYGDETKTQTSQNIGLPAGTYYISVNPWSSVYTSTVDYCLKINFSASSVWEKEPNDDFYFTSNPISLNTNYYGTTMDCNDEDWFKFTLTKAGKVNLSFFHDYIDSTGAYWYVGLYDEDKNRMLDNWIYYGDETKTQTSQNIGLPAGTYYISVNPWSSVYTSTVDYRLKINFSASSVWEKEPNNDYYATSNLISLNKNYYGTTMDCNDEDWFKFKLNSKTKICISFSHEYIDSTGTYWYVGLYDDDKNRITDNWYYYGDEKGTKKTQYITLPAGTYYISVNPWSSVYTSTVDYSLMVSEYLATPKLTKIANTTTGVKVTWGKVTGATSYVVYRKTGSGSWKKIADGIKNIYYTDKTAKSGTTYKYTVRAQKGSLLSGYVKNGISIKCLADPTLKVPTSSRSGITLKWTKTTGASGYVIYRKAGNGSWKKLVTEKGVSNLSYVDKTARKGTTYTYKVRAYYSKTYSAYSNTRQIKDKY